MITPRLPPLVLLIVLCFASLHRAAAEPFTALRDGERFRYQISWGVFSNAGEIVIEAHREKTEHADTIRVKTQISSRGFVRGVFRFDDRGELLIDTGTGRVLSATDEGLSGSKRLESRTVFDYDRRVATHTDAAHPERSREFAIPEGDPVDLISALIQSRDWQPHLGEHRSHLVYFGRDVYPVIIRAEAKRKLSTPLGDFSTMELVPRMETEEPRGVFKRGGEIKVWVSEGASPQPVQMQLNLSFGTARLVLVEHSVGAAAKKK